jgi:hypothetical protein
LDTIVSLPPVAGNEIRFSEQDLTTATQSLAVPPSPVLQRRRIDETLATNLGFEDTSSYLNIRSISRSCREFDD